MAGDPAVRPETAVIEAVRESDEVASPQEVVRNLGKRGLDEALVSAAILRLLNEQKLILRWDRHLELPSRFREELARMTETASAVGRAVETGALAQALQGTKTLAAIAETQKWFDLANGRDWQRLAETVRQMQRVRFSRRHVDDLLRAAREVEDITTNLSALSKGLETRLGKRNARSSKATAKSRATSSKKTAAESRTTSRKATAKSRATSG